MFISAWRTAAHAWAWSARLGRASLIAVLAAPACARFGYDLDAHIQSAGAGGAVGVGMAGSDGLGAIGGASPASDSSARAGAGSEAQPPIPEPGADASTPAPVGEGGAAPDRDDAGGGSEGGRGGGPRPEASPCALRGDETVVHGFDSGTNGARAVGAGAPQVDWNGVDGTPNPGCLQYTNAAAGRAQVRYDGALGDLSGRRISVNVRELSAANVHMRLFVETGQSQARAFGASTSAAPNWGCLTLDLAAPAAADPDFDPRTIRAIGVEIDGPDDVRSQLDQVAY